MKYKVVLYRDGMNTDEYIVDTTNYKYDDGEGYDDVSEGCKAIELAIREYLDYYMMFVGDSIKVVSCEKVV